MEGQLTSFEILSFAKNESKIATSVWKINSRILRGVVLLWAGRTQAPQFLAQNIVKVGLGPSSFSDKKGPKYFWKVGHLHFQMHD